MSAVSPALLLPATHAGISRAAELLSEGKLVVVPTETLYGIAVNLASAAARQAARATKSPPATANADTPLAPWVIHTASLEDFLSWVPHLSAIGRRLVSKSLPGPVAFEVRLDPAAEFAARERLAEAADEAIHDGLLTLRCPDFGLTQDLLKAVPHPVAIMGAGNLAQPAVFEVSELPTSLTTDAPAGAAPGASPVAAILDGGPTRYRRSSTLVRIDGDKFSITRPGVIDERILQRMADFTILFLCSGNTCRSPMAASLASKILGERLDVAPSELPLRHIVVQSAGLHASHGMRATVEALEAVQELGADLSAHISQPATPELLRRADAIYTMTNAHRQEVLHLLPAAERKTFRLDPSGDVADPFGSSFPVYQKVASRLRQLLQSRLNELPV